MKKKTLKLTLEELIDIVEEADSQRRYYVAESNGLMNDINRLHNLLGMTSLIAVGATIAAVVAILWAWLQA